MKEQLSDLRSLQSIDKHLQEVRQAQKKLDDDLKALRQGVILLNSELLRREEELDETHQLKEEHEAALKVQEESLTRSKGKMAGVKKNQEWMAAQREVENGRKATADRETELLKIIEIEEATRVALKERRQRLTELYAAVRAFEANHAERTAELESRIGTFATQRQEILDRLPKRISRLYARIYEARDNIALAQVKDEQCLVCHMMLQPQLYNNLQRGDTIETCPSCNRILYFVNEAEEAGAATL